MVHRQPFMRNGHCVQCGGPTRHAHLAQGLFWRLHQSTFQLLPRLGLGRWACTECYSERALLAPVRRPTGVETSGSTFEPDGNFIVGNLSLVRRSLKTSRYTEKFRDSVVERLVSGQVNLESVRSELRVREADVMAWIADRLQRQQDRVSQLTRMLEVLAGSHPADRLESDQELMNPETTETVVDCVSRPESGLPFSRQFGDGPEKAV